MYNTSMKDRINSYFATLIITIAGASAVWLIVNIAYSDTLSATFDGSEAEYAPLQQSILNQ